MSSHSDVQTTIRKYLLGQLQSAARDEFEESLMTDDGLFEELSAIEDELLDEYVQGELRGDDKAMFEKNFLVTPDGQQRLRFARSLRKYSTAQVSSEQAQAIKSQARWPITSNWYVRAAAFAVLAIALFGAWRIFFSTSEVQKGLLALNAAYREQRPIEARITELDYAPFLTTRGPGSIKFNETEQRRAELTLLDALTRKPTAEAHHALGKVYLAKRDFDRAIEQLDAALKADGSKATIYADLGAAWLEKGKLDLEKSEPESVSGQGMEELGRSLQNLTKALELNSSLLEALFNKALAEEYLKLYAQAEQDWQDYLKKDPTSPWSREAQQNLKLLEERKARASGTKDQLIADFLSAYDSQNNDAAWTALSLSRSRTGNIILEKLLDDFLSLANTGRTEEANETLEKVSYAGTLEERRIQDRFTSNLAQAYATATPAERITLAQARETTRSAIEAYNKAEWTKAIDLFSQSRDLFEQTRDEPEMLFVEAFIGYCLLRIPDPDKSTPIFDRLSKIFEERNYRSLLAQSLLALADTANARNEFSIVLERAEQSLSVSEQVQDHATVARCLLASTTVQGIVGDYQASLASIFRGLSVVETLTPDVKLSWPFYHEASNAFYFLGMPGVALQFEDEALRLALEGGLTLQTSRSYDRLALIHEQLKNFAEAFKNSDKARLEGMKLSDERAKTNILAHSSLIAGRLYRESKNPQRAVESLDEALNLYQKLNLDIYQYQARKGKLLALMELHDDPGAETELAKVLYWFEQNRQKIAEESYRNKFFDTDQNTYDVAVDFQYSRKKDAAKAFEYAEAYRARSLLDLLNTESQITGDLKNPEIKLSASTTPLTLNQIQRQLPANVQLVEYSVLDDKLIMWVVSRDTLKSAHSDLSRVELDVAIRKFLDSLTRGNTEEAISHAKELYRSVVSPIERELNRNAQLCIVPDDSLSFLPFAALMSPNSGRYLVEDYAIETSASATLFVSGSARAAEKGTYESERVLVVGNPAFNRQQFPDLPDLPGAAREATEVAKIYGVSPLLGKAASSARVTEGILDSEVVHLATHALPDERSPLLSKLVLSGDQSPSQDAHHATTSVLKAAEIYAMKLPRTRLVVLSACQTGIERAYRGEGAIGLARPFIAAGVPLVIASLWAVESESTADLMISFHKHRKQDHVSTVEALRLAQLEILHNRQLGSPQNYSWAAFVAIGGYARF